jgi:dCMP deaminase
VGFASGQGLDACEAIHAEQNALLQCRDVHLIKTCYLTLSPCITCVKLLLNTSCERIVFIEEYVDARPKDLWEAAGRTWEKYHGIYQE